MIITANEKPIIRRRLLRGCAKSRTGKRCWNWTGYTKNGYGAMSVHDRMLYTHRLSFVANKGPIPACKEVCHTCDNPTCIRPSHLFAGTRLDNITDARSKGRMPNPPRCVGLKQHKATLTSEECKEVRRLIRARTPQRVVADMFDISQSTAWRIGNGKTRAEA